MGIRADRGMRCASKVDIIAQHISARKTRPYCIEICLAADELVHIGIREILVLARAARSRCSRSIAHMHITFVIAHSLRPAGIHRKRTLIGYCIDIRRINLCIVHDAHTLAFEDDCVRLDRAAAVNKTDDIGLSQSRRTGRAPIDDTAFDPGSRRIIEVDRAIADSFANHFGIELARRHIEVADVDAGAVAKDDTVRVGDIDVLAALHLAVDARGDIARDDIQIVVRIMAAVKLDGLTALDGEILPADDIVRRGARDARRRSRLTDCGAARTHAVMIISTAVGNRCTVRRRGNAEEAGKETEADLTSQGVFLAHSSHFSSSFLSQEKPPQDVVAFFPSRLLPRQVIEAAKATCIFLITATGSAHHSTTGSPVRA